MSATIKVLESTTAFLRMVQRRVRSRGIKLLLVNEPFLDFDDGIPCSGYFDDGEKVLIVATYKPVDEWLQVLTHEFGHFCQWVENCSEWRQIASRGRNSDACPIFDLAMIGRRTSQKRMQRAINALIAVELDCEKRAVALIKKYRLPIDVETYIQKANSYICFYHEAARLRCWYNPLKPPFLVDSIWKNMPKDFDSIDYFNPECLRALPDFSPAMGKPLHSPATTKRLAAADKAAKRAASVSMKKIGARKKSTKKGK